MTEPTERDREIYDQAMALALIKYDAVSGPGAKLHDYVPLKKFEREECAATIAEAREEGRQQMSNMYYSTEAGPHLKLILALVKKLPPTGTTEWKIQDRVMWLQMAAMAFQMAYGPVEPIEIKSANQSQVKGASQTALPEDSTTANGA
jgi:hypothetical protein